MIDQYDNIPTGRSRVYNGSSNVSLIKVQIKVRK